MGEATAAQVLTYLRSSGAGTLDLTGGAPELSPVFRSMVREARALGVRVMDRCNLTVMEEPGQEDLAEFLAQQRVEIVASLPCYLEENVDQQRGTGVFEGSVRGLQRLNALGYGHPGSGLTLDLVYNPLGPSLPPPQGELEEDYRESLGSRFGIVFDRLYTLANMPIQRFGSLLLSTGRFDAYLDLLRQSHRSENLATVMCRTLLSVDWRGHVYDCDFNQMLGLPLLLGEAVDPAGAAEKAASGRRVHLTELLDVDLAGNPIAVAGHCFGCTAGQGSSCGGALN
jgi:radical SAM/Cys-rich protein